MSVTNTQYFIHKSHLPFYLLIIKKIETTMSTISESAEEIALRDYLDKVLSHPGDINLIIDYNLSRYFEFKVFMETLELSGRTDDIVSINITGAMFSGFPDIKALKNLKTLQLDTCSFSCPDLYYMPSCEFSYICESGIFIGTNYNGLLVGSITNNFIKQNSQEIEHEVWNIEKPVNPIGIDEKRAQLFSVLESHFN